MKVELGAGQAYKNEQAVVHTGYYSQILKQIQLPDMLGAARPVC